IPGIFSLIRYGLRPAIDFTGGTLVEIKFTKDISVSTIETTAKTVSVSIGSVQKTSTNTYLLRLQHDTDVAKLTGALKNNGPEIIRDETVGPVLGKELLQKTVTAALIALIAILSYVAYAF